jgi:16S rRNA (guanine966-N2)-methyltransferase
MRIIAGKYRGRRLQGPRKDDLRPTSDRLRESLFNILAPRIAAARVMDVFAGTGAIGLEALSRGAGDVIFIESSRDAVKLIRKNLQQCGVTAGYRVMQEDVFTALRTLARSGARVDIVFLDPPYRWGPYRDLIASLFQLELVDAEAIVVLEHHQKTSVPESEPGFRRMRTVRQSDKCLSFYVKETPE